jgi:hypothetical protein
VKKKWRERRKSRPFELNQPETGATGEPSSGLKITPKTLYLQPQNQTPPFAPPPTHTHKHNEDENKRLPDFSSCSVFFNIPSREGNRRKRREK